MVTLKIDPYDICVELHISDAEKSVQSIIRRHGNYLSDYLEPYRKSFCFAITKNVNDYQLFAISIDKGANDKVIWHESLHMAYYILHHVWVKVGVHNHESLAYLQGDIAEKIFSKLHKRKRK